MSEIKTIGELRNELKVCGCDPDECMSCSVPRKVKDGLDKVEREIAERYMQLPEDVNGVPIHMGDTIEGELLDDSTVRGTVCAFHLYDDEPDSVYIKVNLHGVWTIKELRIARCRHVKPRTVEDVLMDVMSDFADADFNDETLETITARYADEIRELLGGDA